MTKEPDQANQPSDQSEGEATEAPRYQEISPNELAALALSTSQTSRTKRPQKAKPAPGQSKVEATDAPRDQEMPPSEARFEERVGRRLLRNLLRKSGVQEEAIKKTIQRNRKKGRA